MHEAVPNPDDQLNQRDAEYPNHIDDPSPPEKNATKSVHTTYQKKVKVYSHSILSAYNKFHMRGDVLWEDYTAFRSQ